MNLILFRHGNAEDRRYGLDDKDRKLTQKGIDNVSSAAKVLSEHIGRNGNSQIWSSPLIRAVETASLLQDTMNLGSIKKLDCIATGDYEELQSVLLNTPQEATIIIVGHNPSLEEWYTNICSQSIHLKKASIVDINITQLQPLEGQMVWSHL